MEKVQKEKYSDNSALATKWTMNATMVTIEVKMEDAFKMKTLSKKETNTDSLMNKITSANNLAFIQKLKDIEECLEICAQEDWT